MAEAETLEREVAEAEDMRDAEESLESRVSRYKEYKETSDESDAKYEKPSRYNAKISEKSEKKDTDGKKFRNGSVAIIHNPETGEFYVEQKPVDYAVAKYRGTIALVGGAKEEGESHLEALVREMSEEVEDPMAKFILIKELIKNGRLYDVITTIEGGKPVTTHVWVVELTGTKWKIFSDSDLTHDAGNPRVLKAQDIIRMNDVYLMNPALKRFAKEHYGSRISNPTSYIHQDAFKMEKFAYPIFAYPMPWNSFSTKNENSINTKINYSPISYAPSLL